MIRMKIHAMLMFVVCLTLATGCQHTTEQVKKEPVFSDSLLRTMQFVKADEKIVEEDLTLTAKIDYNRDKVVDVYPLVGGRVSAVKAELGDYVEKGQVLDRKSVV